jgi:hypothetical protein
MEQLMQTLQSLQKAMEAGQMNAAPSALQQGAALQVEDLSPKMENLCAQEKNIKLQKDIKIDTVKSTAPQFTRQLSYGQVGGGAVWEGAVGQEETSDFLRVQVPMCYYAHMRRVTMQADAVATVDGMDASDRAADDAGKKIAFDIEFDLFRGKELFTNGGVFDGNPLSVAELPNMFGLDIQIRQSDTMRAAKDLMFQEYGSDESVILSVGSALTQAHVEDSAVRSSMQNGEAERLYLDPKSLSAYNKIGFDKERIVLAGSAQGNTGSDLRKQFTSVGAVELTSSRFLAAKTLPAPQRLTHPSAPGAPTALSYASTTVSGVTTTFTTAQNYIFYVTGGNEIGESGKFTGAATAVSVNGDALDLTVTHPAGLRFINVYRSTPGGSAATAKFIGRVKTASLASTSTVFRDLNNRKPGAVTGYLLQMDTFAGKELSGYKRAKLAQVDLSTVEAHYRWLTLAVFQPRKNVLLDNIG